MRGGGRKLIYDAIMWWHHSTSWLLTPTSQTWRGSYDIVYLKTSQNSSLINSKVVITWVFSCPARLLFIFSQSVLYTPTRICFLFVVLTRVVGDTVLVLVSLLLVTPPGATGPHIACYGPRNLTTGTYRHVYWPVVSSCTLVVHMACLSLCQCLQPPLVINFVFMFSTISVTLSANQSICLCQVCPSQKRNNFEKLMNE